ncbi:MAG: hypothetical protein ABSF70_06725 [Terracidiphilus sp.]
MRLDPGWLTKAILYDIRKGTSLDRPPTSPVALLSPAAQLGEVSVERIVYHDWAECYLIANGSIEAVIVPAIGRVMQLRLAGDPDGAFWENRSLDGQLHDAASNDWTNFGGDKCWPAPQTVWTGQQGRDWPPPDAFDALPAEAVPSQRGVVVTSPIDSCFGIQVVRHIELDAEQPIMRIGTEYRKLFGSAVKVGIWTVTQMQEPKCVCMLLPEKSKFASGYVRLLATEPADLQIDGRLLSLGRHLRNQVKIGTDGNSLAWVGLNCVVRINAEIGRGEYPDGGCVTEVYTNPDPLKYVELETLGPLTTMEAGDRIKRTTVYTVMPRSTEDLAAEVRKAFS